MWISNLPDEWTCRFYFFFFLFFFKNTKLDQGTWWIIPNKLPRFFFLNGNLYSSKALQNKKVILRSDRGRPQKYSHHPKGGRTLQRGAKAPWNGQTILFLYSSNCWSFAVLVHYFSIYKDIWVGQLLIWMHHILALAISRTLIYFSAFGTSSGA